MEALVFKGKDNQALTNSLLVAEKFSKEHRNVMQSIRNLTAENSAVLKMFCESTYLNEQNKEQPMYIMNRDGFTLLVMGFTGKKALQFKMDYIEAFNQMEKELKTPTLSSAEIILQIAQLNVQQERRLSTVEKSLDAIIEEKEQSKYDLDYLPVSDDPMPGMSLRKKILAIANTYSKATQMDHRTLWNSIYDKLYYNYGVALRRCKKINKSETWLEVAERKGHLGKIYSIVSELVKAK